MMNSNFNSKFITAGFTNSNFTSGVVAHSLCKLHNLFLNAQILLGPPNDFSWYSLECLFKVNKGKVQFPVLIQMFFLQLSEDEYCISCVPTRHEAKLHVIDEYPFPDDLFHHSLNSFHDMIKGSKTFVVTFYLSITFPFVDIVDKAIFPDRSDGTICYHVISKVTNQLYTSSTKSLQHFSNYFQGLTAFPFFILIIAFATISIGSFISRVWRANNRVSSHVLRFPRELFIQKTLIVLFPSKFIGLVVNK